MSRLKFVLMLSVAVAATLSAQTVVSPVWTSSVQTGMADTFQLTLGGTFGNGPAWQNKVSTGLANAFRAGDAITVYAWDTFDTRRGPNNWQAGIGYKTPVLKKRNHMLALGSGLQHWRFPSVKTGTNDWLIPGNLVYQTQTHKFPITVTQDSWTLLKSPLPLGSLLHTQAWIGYNLYKRERFTVSFKNGPAHTYSWNFYGTNGNRVIRYQTMLAVSYKDTSLEGGYRKQWGLQRGIVDNKYWQFALTRTLNRPLR